MSLIKVVDVSKSYPANGRNVPALDSINLDIRKGEFVAIIGPSGCGKTTLLKIIGGLVPPTSGIVRINGAPSSHARTKKEFSYVFQNPALLPWRSVKGNALLPLEIISGERGEQNLSRVEKLLGVMGLSEFKDHLPHQLSGGMQQRVAFARALSFNPSFLLMDEPFSALDELTRDSLDLYLLDIWDRLGFTAVYITHSVKEAVFLADRIIVLSERPGRVIKSVSINLPRPRKPEIKYSKKFTDLVRLVSLSLKQIQQKEGARQKKGRPLSHDSL